MSKLNMLFDFSKFEKRKPEDQQQFESVNKQMLMDFKEFVSVSFKKLHQRVLSMIEPVEQDKNLHATVMNGLLKGHFIKKYMHYCGKATTQRFMLYVNNVSIYVKKLDEKTKLPSNIPTDASLKIHNQLTDTPSDNGCNVFLGYTVSEDWGMITGVYAVCIEGEEKLWITDLSNFGEESQTPIVPMPPRPIVPRIKEGVSKKKKQADNNS